MPTALVEALPLHDCHPQAAHFLEDVLEGLSRPVKQLPCKYFYDERGSQLFDQICELDEYYPTRTETAIMCEYGSQMARRLGPDCLLIEYGSGSSIKTRTLLDELRAQECEPAAYVPLDISREHLLQSAARLAEEYPWLPVLPVCADYTTRFSLPATDAPVSKSVVYFPGSTIGNFHPTQAREFLRQIAQTCGAGGGLLIGVDLEKPSHILEAAYNDSSGVTAEFNLNLLHRINREVGANFHVDDWEHLATYNHQLSRIEMHLISRCRQSVDIAGTSISFEAGESIHTECSYKYMLAKFERLAVAVGWQLERVWTDDRQLFSVQYLTFATEK